MIITSLLKPPLSTCRSLRPCVEKVSHHIPQSVTNGGSQSQLSPSNVNWCLQQDHLLYKVWDLWRKIDIIVMNESAIAELNDCFV